MIGTKLGPYEITAKLGEGGMGEVYRAQASRLGRAVALGLLSSGSSVEAVRLRRFEREALALGLAALGRKDDAIAALLERVGLADDSSTVSPRSPS